MKKLLVNPKRKWYANGNEITDASLEDRFEIYIDASLKIGRLKHNWANFNYGWAHPARKSELVQKSYKLVTDSGIFKYVLLHNIYVNGAIKNGRICLEWSELDEICDRLLSYELKPFLQVNPVPGFLATKRYCEPRDFKHWQEYMHLIVGHLCGRYGVNEVRKWYFEILSEPDLLLDEYASDIRNYCKVYDYAVAGAVSACSQIRIGGPTACGRTSFLKGFLDHCTKGRNYVTGRVGSRLDLVSFHAYSHSPDKKPMIAHIREKVQEIKTLISCYPSLTGVPVLLADWGISWGGGLNAFPTRDRSTHFTACFTCKLIKDLADMDLELINFCGFHEYSMGRQEGLDFDKRRALITKNGIKRPAFLAYKLLAMLGKNRIYLGRGPNGFRVDGIATMDDDTMTVLLYHYYDNPEQKGWDSTVDIVIKGLPPGWKRCLCEEYRLDAEHSNTYSAWLKAGAPRNPGNALIEQINGHEGKLSPLRKSHIMIRQGALHKQEVIPLHGILLLKLKNLRTL